MDAATIRSAPKVALHDHLDGGLRPATVIELAAEVGHDLPANDPVRLGAWFLESSTSGSLERYLETFDHTVAVMQTEDALRRVACEFVLDQAADGVIYAEARWAPEQHVHKGLSLEQTIAAVRDGLAEGMAQAKAAGTPIVARQLITGMRHANRSREIAELAVRWREDSVAGFDIAGAEAGFPPAQHLPAFQYLKENNAYITIHAGEAFGLPSIWEAVQVCGANRIGHGVRIADDISTGPQGRPRLGLLAAYVRNQRIPLELCPTSNVQTGAAPSIAEHPFGLLAQLGFRVTVNCDNRLMSDTTMSKEFGLLADAFGYGLDDLHRFTLNAMKSAFLPFDERVQLITEVIDPGYQALAD